MALIDYDNKVKVKVNKIIKDSSEYNSLEKVKQKAKELGLKIEGGWVIGYDTSITEAVQKMEAGLPKSLSDDVKKAVLRQTLIRAQDKARRKLIYEPFKIVSQSESKKKAELLDKILNGTGKTLKWVEDNINKVNEAIKKLS